MNLLLASGRLWSWFGTRAGRSPDTVFEALEDAATLFAESRWKGGKWESPSACQL